MVVVGVLGNDDGGDGHICFGIYGGCGDRIVVEYGGVVFIQVTAAAVPKKMMERRVRGDKRGKKAVTEGGKKALTALVWGQKNGFYFKLSLKFMRATDDTSQLPIS